MCYAPVCFPCSDPIDFKINPIFYDQKKKLKYIANEKEKSFQGEIQSTFLHFKELSGDKTCL